MSEEKQAPKEIAKEIWEATPSEVKQLVFAQGQQIESLTSTLGEMQALTNKLTKKVEELTLEVTTLKARLNQNSQNSSRPPSSDLPYKDKPKRPAKGGSSGGQHGHEGNHRAFVELSEVTHLIEVRPETCGHCATPLGEDLKEALVPVRQQIYEIPEVKPIITEYRLHALSCPNCLKITRAKAPAEMPQGGYGPRVRALVAQLHGRFRLSMDQTSEALLDLFGVPVSTGSVSTICHEVSDALANVYQELRDQIPQEAVLNIDETTWKERGHLKYLWGVVATSMVVYEIAGKRDTAVLAALLTNQFAGIVGSDRHGSYNLIPNGRRQVCLAHVKRNLVAAHERGGAGKEWAGAAVELINQIFSLWHQAQEKGQSRPEFADELKPLRDKFKEHLEKSNRLPRGPTKSLGRNLLKLEEALFTFSTKQGVEPTNNAAEQALRGGVIWRKTSFGTQSDHGSRFVERMLSVVATCQKRGTHILTFLTDTVRAHSAGLPTPSITIASPSA